MTDPLAGLDASLAPPPLGAELERELGALTPAPPRKPMRQLGVIVAASVGWAFALAGLLSVRRDLTELPRVWLAIYLAAWLVGFVAPLAVLVVPRPGSMMPRWRIAVALGGLAAVGFVIAGLTMARSAPHSVVDSAPFRHVCMPTGLATAVVPILLAVIALRGTIPNASRWSAAALGAAAGCIGGFMLHLHCAISDAMHLGVVHGGVVVLSALLAALLAPRWLATR